MAYYVRGSSVFNYDDMWDLLRAAGELHLPALTAFAFGESPAEHDLLFDLHALRWYLPTTHHLRGHVDEAIAILEAEA